MLQERATKSILSIIPFRYLLLLASCLFLLEGCASSGVARSSASGVDRTVQGSKDVYDSATDDNDIASSYQNTSQTTKGALIGGTIGAISGTMSSRFGILPAAGLGAVVGAAFGAYIDAHTTLEDRLENRGVAVVMFGDQVLIVMSSTRLFQPGTANLYHQSYSTLNMVTQYINRFDKVMVKISAYTNPLGPPNVNLALSRDQAHVVEKYLVEAGMDARVVYADGYGGTRLVEKLSKDWDGSDNYRIEITLEKLSA